MHLFFDLDGTLTDSSPGILRCIDHAIVSLGRDPVSHDRIAGMIGAPLSTIFETLLGSADETVIDEAVAAYRSRFNTVGIFENSLYPGILEALEEFQRSGHRLRIVTAKPRVAAERVVEHFGIGRFFEAVHGPQLSDRSCSKADHVAAAIENGGAHRAHCVMIGDRADDVLAAQRCEVAAVAVGWGYGSRAELVAAAPAYLAERVPDLVEWVTRAGRANATPEACGVPPLAQD
jgi:phosphoglycolate phosphatase